MFGPRRYYHPGEAPKPRRVEHDARVLRPAEQATPTRQARRAAERAAAKAKAKQTHGRAR